MADLTSSLRQKRGPFLTDPDVQSIQLTPDENAQIPTGAFTRGLQSSLTNIAAGQAARDAYSAEKNGASNSSALRAHAGELARQSELEAPAIRSYKDINGVGDVVDYAAGAFGGMLPYIPPVVAGAAAGRLLGPGAVGPLLGSGAAMYPLEKGQALLDQYSDPVQAAAPIEQRGNVATTRAVINSALMGGAGSSALRGLAGRASGTMLAGAAEAAIPLAAGHGVAIESQKYLNPNRDTSHDAAGYIDALLQGGALGAAAHIPSSAAQSTASGAKGAAGFVRDKLSRGAASVSEGLGEAAEAAKPGVEGLTEAVKGAASAVKDRVIDPAAEATADFYTENKPRAEKFASSAKDFAEEKVNKFAEATRTAKDFPDFARKVFGKSTDEAENLALGDKSPEFKGPDGKVDEKKLFAGDGPRVEKTQRYADDLLNNENTSEEIKAKVRSFNGDYSSPEAQTYIGRTILGQRGGEIAISAIDALKKGAKELLKNTKDFASEALEGTKDAIIKKSAMDSKTQVKLDDLIFKGFKDELQAQPEVIRQVPELRKIISNLLSRGAQIDDASLQAFGRFHAVDTLFKDPEATLKAVAEALGADDLFKRSSKFSSAFEDAKKSDSMLYRAIPPERREHLTSGDIKELGHFIDTVDTLDDAKYKMAVQGLGREVFGSQEAAKAVFDYYSRANKSELTVEDAKLSERSLLHEEKKDHKSELEKQGINEQELESHTVYASVDKTKERPFHSSEMRNLVDRLEANRGTGRTQIVNMAEHAYREGREPEVELARIEKDIRGRISEHKKHKEYTEGTPTQKEFRKTAIQRLQEQLKGIEDRKNEVLADEQFNMPGVDETLIKRTQAENALQDFHVGRVEADKPDRMVADDDFIRDARRGYSKMTKENREANPNQFVTFETKDGKDLVLHAPSMVRAMGVRQGPKAEETSLQRNVRLFKEAVVSVRSRDDVVALKTKLRGVDLGDGVTIHDAEMARVEETKRVTSLNKEIRDARSELEDNLAETKELIEIGKQTGDWPKSGVLFELSEQRDVLKSKIEKAYREGADEPRLDKTEKQEREEQGLTDVVKEMIEKPEPFRIARERGPKTGDDSRETSQGQYTFDRDIKKKSKENPSPGRDISPEEAQAVRDHVLKTRGPDVQVLTDQFAKDIGGSGEYYKKGAERIIKVARDALNPESVAFHESMHDFFHTLMTDGNSVKLKENLLKAADIPYVQAQLRTKLRNHPEALEQIMKDPEERLAYMYQFWAAGELRISPTATTIFGRTTQWIREVLHVVTRGQQAKEILQAFHDGKLAEPSTVGAIIADLRSETIGDKIESLTKPFQKMTDRLLGPANERLRKVAPGLADMFLKEPDRESGSAGFIQRRGQTQGKFANTLQDVLDKSTAEGRATAINELQSMQPPTTEIGKGISKLLSSLYDYMEEAGVKNSVLNSEGKPEWMPVRRVKDYFPRVFDRAEVRAREQEFKDLLMKEGSMDASQAEATFKVIVSGEGDPGIAESEHHIGFTPYSSAVKNRALTFINKTNAAKFAEFQSKDLVNVLHTYIYQAVHRGEYARLFGNDGEVIQQHLRAAEAAGKTPEEVRAAAQAVRAMEGTLGADINPRLRELYSGVVGYENIVLLPLALFSSLIDPLGVAIRSGSMKDAAIAFKDGVKGLFSDAFRLPKDAEYEMGRTIGLIDNLNQLEAMGQVMNSQYMSKWMRKVNETFFKLNGMETWNERMRVSAMGAGMRFMVRNKNNERYMHELGLKASDVKELSDGRIARTQEEGLSIEQEQRVQEAIYRFVDGAILRPNAAHRPVWSSDPHYMLVAHLKQYTFSFQQTILKQVKKEFLNGNAAPAWMLASYVPFMAASDLMRGSLIGTIKNAWTVSDFFADGIARSGVLGTGSFVTDAMKDASMGNMPGSSFLGPAGQHAIMAAKTVAGAPGVDWHDLVARSLPASPLTKLAL